MRILTNAPLAMSASTMCMGMCPQPSPAFKNECFAPRSASRHVAAESEVKARWGHWSACAMSVRQPWAAASLLTLG